MINYLRGNIAGKHFTVENILYSFDFPEIKGE